ncbi:bifunctional hydroxymethylpyrimidine kinase/phosphomethylpyrimidine kinase [Polycladidibacter stylochi]|uniref:bifunctional hydroxymethylpyrimidine kinase/phosphomethylpyrimidine kinase n=1 Tax=Polycladidibacter stylochi TaxID=1807766 RepID=UPI00082B61CB|nr:bifunctional hydroxymethylpyrimidine kinase/phosphomethylpyrimidine kinase [Pseudovibrio stylochi]
MIANAVTIAGSDSGGGAGIQADLKAFSARGVYGASVISALTAQNTVGVQGIFDVSADFVGAQIQSVFSDLKIGAVKIGMLSQPLVIECVAEALQQYQNVPVVLDPVMVATSGDVLLQSSAVNALTDKLFPLAELITPNLHEAAHLLGCDVAESKEDMAEQGARLLALGCENVLIKGGHFCGATSDDLLIGAVGEQWLSGPRHKTENTHGTGCTLSAAIAAERAKGSNLVEAVCVAKDYVNNAIFHADRLQVGRGHGPVHHFFELWAHNNLG